MANTKQVVIAAEVNYCYYEDEEMARFMAFLQSPTCGFHVQFGPRGYYNLPNPGGGKMATYQLGISGYEAVSDSWLDAFGKALARNSNPSNGPTLKWRDAENNLPWHMWKPDMALAASE